MERVWSKTKCFDMNGRCIVQCDKEYFRPLEVDTLLGDPLKLEKNLIGSQRLK